MSRFPSQLAAALDRELEQLDRYFHSRGIPEGLDAQRARLLLERARERSHQAYDEVARGQSLQHGSALVQAVARGKHPAMAYQEGQQQAAQGLSDEFAQQRRIRYLEQVIPGLREAERAKEIPPITE